LNCSKMACPSHGWCLRQLLLQQPRKASSCEEQRLTRRLRRCRCLDLRIS